MRGVGVAPPQPPQRPQRPTRPSQAARGPSKSVQSADVERALALRDVMNHAVKVEKEFKRATPVKASNGRLVGMMLICIPLLAFSIYSWVARPAFIWGQPVEPLPAVEQEAGMRFSMFLMAMRVEAYRESEGLYPASLASLGESLAGATYAMVSDTAFELRAMVNGREIVFRSDARADVFLGNSTAIIQGLSR